MGGRLEEPSVEQLEKEVFEEVLQYCCDTGTPPTADVVSETVGVRREQSGPGRMQELYDVVESRLRERLHV